MKKHLSLVLVMLCSVCLGCGSSHHSPDPLADFRTFAGELRQLSYDALTQTGKELDDLDDTNPKKNDYVIAMEDLLIGQTYGMTILNKVIRFQIRSRTDTVYTNTDRDSTLDVADGIYVFQTDYYIRFEEANTVEKIHATITWNPDSHRWMFIALRGGSSIQAPMEPWFRQEGEIINGTNYYFATNFYLKEDPVSHINTVQLVYTGPSITVQMACERLACTTDCVDTTTTDLYSEGLESAGLLSWDDFKLYGIDDLDPDYEIP